MGRLSEYDSVELDAMDLSGAVASASKLADLMREVIDQANHFLSTQHPRTVELARLRLQGDGIYAASSPLEIAAEIEEMSEDSQC